MSFLLEGKARRRTRVAPRVGIAPRNRTLPKDASVSGGQVQIQRPKPQARFFPQPQQQQREVQQKQDAMQSAGISMEQGESSVGSFTVESGFVLRKRDSGGIKKSPRTMLSSRGQQ
jgi:hypothetical protein